MKMVSSFSARSPQRRSPKPPKPHDAAAAASHGRRHRLRQKPPPPGSRRQVRSRRSLYIFFSFEPQRRGEPASSWTGARETFFRPFFRFQHCRRRRLNRVREVKASFKKIEAEPFAVKFGQLGHASVKRLHGSLASSSAPAKTSSSPPPWGFLTDDIYEEEAWFS